MEATLLLTRVKSDKALPASKKKSPIPHPHKRRLRASFSLMVRKKASSQQSRQAPPIWPERKELRLPCSRQKQTSCLTLWAREGRKLLTTSSSSSEDGRELTIKKKGWSSPDLQKERSGAPPLPNSSGLERPSTLFHRRQCLAHPFFFSGHDALENFQSQGESPSCFLALML